mmetsp:Transcript_1775/g.5085  ORF Transcript_1775/g.5085 Transcript_1775/m.5085 type:complete len:141 (+) Transcript_1775:209-631(+)
MTMSGCCGVVFPGVAAESSTIARLVDGNLLWPTCSTCDTGTPVVGGSVTVGAPYEVCKVTVGAAAVAEAAAGGKVTVGAAAVAGAAAGMEAAAIGAMADLASGAATHMPLPLAPWGIPKCSVGAGPATAAGDVAAPGDEA